MQRRCKNCKWWGELGGLPPLRTCQHPKLTAWPEEIGVMPNTHQSIYASDIASDFETGILTGPDFGCIHFEAKAGG